MRALEFLREYTDVKTAQQNIITVVSGLTADNEQDAQLIDKIYKILNQGDIKDKIAQTFNITTADDNFNIQPLIQKITQLIFHVDSDYKKINAFLDKLAKGNVVNPSAFKTVGAGPLSALFNGDETATKVYTALAEVGAGKLQKGPGEYGMAMMSKSVTLRTEEGDLDVVGAGRIEVKAEMSTGGGRLGDGGPRREDAVKYWSVLPSVADHIQNKAKTLSVKNLVRYLAVDLPLNDATKKKQRQDLLTKWYSGIFKQPAEMVNACMQNNQEKAELDYAVANFNEYKRAYGWDICLAINFTHGKYAVMKDGTDFANLRNSGQLGSFSISAIPSQARPSEVYAQLSMLKSKA